MTTPTDTLVLCRAVRRPNTYQELVDALESAPDLDLMPDPLPVRDVGVEIRQVDGGYSARLIACRFPERPLPFGPRPNSAYLFATLYEMTTRPDPSLDVRRAALMLGEFLQLPGTPNLYLESPTNVPQSRTPNPES